ncbi:MAG TPA: hypothetical protein PLS49_07725, partial [Candidatus Woesebacteria bacterium]|nr:hypothetical protein [Candidatus Woesebacteria bacterium]
MNRINNIKIILSFIFFTLAIILTSLAINSYQLYVQSRAATDTSNACITTLAEIADKCSGGVLSEDVCQFKPGGDLAVGWTTYALSGNPTFENTDYSSLGEGTIKMTPNGSDSYKAGAYTQVDVTPGKMYCASWRWGAPGPDNAPDHYGRTLG